MGTLAYYLANLSRKLHENEKKIELREIIPGYSPPPGYAKVNNHCSKHHCDIGVRVPKVDLDRVPVKKTMHNSVHKFLLLAKHFLALLLVSFQ